MSSGPSPAARAAPEPLDHRREESRLGGGVGAGQRSHDEGPLTRSGPGETLAFQIAVGLEHGIRVDGQLSDDLLGRRQLIARLEEAQLQGLVDLLDQLQIGGDSRSGVQLEFDHHSSFH